MNKNLKQNIKKTLLFFLILCGTMFSQKNSLTKLDTLGIEFKAKLLTIERNGLPNKNYIIEEIEERKILYLKTEYTDFMFLKIIALSPVGWYKNSFCNYYLSYNKKTRVFYKLGGFDFLDLDSFFEDLSHNQLSMWEFETDVEEINLECLYKYYILPEKKKNRKKINCHCKCSDEIIRELMFYHKKG